MQALTGGHTKQWLFVEVLHAPQLRQRSSSVSKFLSFLQYYLIIQICIYSLSLAFICDCKRKLSLCINYSFFARSSQGPEDMGNYSLCHWSCWTPADKEHCWWGHGAHNSPSKTLTLILRLPLSFALSPLKLTLLLSSFLDVKGCEEDRVRLSFSPLSMGSPLRHSNYYSLPPPPEGLFNRWLLSYLSLKQKSPRNLIQERKKKERNIEKELRYTSFLLNNSLSPCCCRNEIHKCVSWG